MSATRQMLSVGIDIGTTTTQIIFSELSLAESARTGQIPRLEIAARRVLHESEIVFTPLLDPETIDASALSAYLRREYQRAGLTPQHIETGAVIITGETARKKNADQILSAIAGLAGDFVVTIAGPNVEGLIAGRGSGAAAYSRQHFTTVTNLDIGGGSANSAVFRLGSMVASAAMSYGGRLVELRDGVVIALTRPGQWVCEAAGLRLAPGDRPSLADLTRLTDTLAGVTVHLIEGTTSPLASRLYQTPPTPVSGRGRPLMLSGGIGYYYYNPISINTVFDLNRHGDIGPLLAQSLRLSPLLSVFTILRPAETQRATVLGASSQTLILSGSTIWADHSILPLKNIPVVRPVLDGPIPDPQTLTQAITSALSRWDMAAPAPGEAGRTFALSLQLDHPLDYPELVQLARGLAAFAATLPPAQPLVAIIKSDYAQALGQTIQGLLGPGSRRPLLLIDQVGLDEGDYIDLGLPLMDGRVVPLVVKTLIFYN